MDTKKCFKCGDVKNLDEFYKHPAMNDGRLGKCKSCAKSDVTKNRNKKIEHYRTFDKLRASMPHRVAARNEYAATPAGTAAANRAKFKWSTINKDKRKSHQAVSNAVRAGSLIKQIYCSECGKSECRIEGHHDDYLKPMDVRWLCSACHRAWHKLNGSFDYQIAA